jgi:hypothetical protein
MKGYTMRKAGRGLGLLLCLVVCLVMAGCAGVAAELWMMRYRVKGGYQREDTEMRRRGDAEVLRDAEMGRRGDTEVGERLLEKPSTLQRR